MKRLAKRIAKISCVAYIVLNVPIPYGIAFTTGFSMEPTISPSASFPPSFVTFRTVDKKPGYKFRRGQLVTFYDPVMTSMKLLKRITAIPGDQVRLVKVNEDWKEELITIQQGQIWVEGDNLSNSLDSRRFGPIYMNSIDEEATGVVRNFKYFPLAPKTLPDQSLNQPRIIE